MCQGAQIGFIPTASTSSLISSSVIHYKNKLVLQGGKWTKISLYLETLKITGTVFWTLTANG